MPAQELFDFCQTSQPRWLKLLEQMVNIDSGSRDRSGLEAMIKLLESRWQALGFKTEKTDSESGPQLLASHRSTNPDAPTVLMVGHVDTVFDRGAAQKRPFTVRDGRAYGPGVADMKGGIVSMLGVVETLKEHESLAAANFIVVHNCDEEIGSKYSKNLIESAAERADVALIFEPGRADGSIVTQRKGGQSYVLKITGKAAHSGVNPQDGASAIEALSKKVVALHQLTDYDAGLTVNVGVINGGSRSNVVADQALAEIDVRIPTHDIAEEVKQAIHDIAFREDVAGTTSQLTCQSERGPMVPSSKTAPLIELYQKTASELGIDLQCAATGGGSDGNFTSAKGVPTLDALGPVGGFYHSEDEYLEIDSLPVRIALAATVIQRLANAISTQ